jgi:Spy/CpxP family protein refolding chaperone
MRRFAHAALLAGAIGIAASAFGHTAIASAEPPWDIEAFDNCMQRPDANEATCCILSDGVWGANGHCQAPPGRILQQTILQQIPLGPKLGSAQPPVPPTTTLGTPVS